MLRKVAPPGRQAAKEGVNDMTARLDHVIGGTLAATDTIRQRMKGPHP